MKRSLLASLSFTLGLLAHSHAGATIVYDAGAPDQAGGFIAADSNQFMIAATRATFSTAITFNGIDWWGFYTPLAAFHNIPLLPDWFRLFIYRGDGGIPGDLLRYLDLGSGNRTATGLTVQGRAEYSYTSSAPVTSLPAGSYFFGFSNAYGDQAGLTWAWETTAVGAGGATLDSTSFPFTWRAFDNEHLAFRLTHSDRQVPEPATALLIGTVLAGLGFARLRAFRT